MNLESPTLPFDGASKPVHLQQAAQIRACMVAWVRVSHARTPRVSVSCSIFPLVSDLDRACFDGNKSQHHFGDIELTKRAALGVQLCQRTRQAGPTASRR